MLRFNKNKKNKITAIDKLRSEELDLVSFDLMSQIPYNETQEIYPENKGSVTCTRVKTNNKNTLSFRVTMKKGEKWYNHYHDCSEVIIVYEGSLIHIEKSKVCNIVEILQIQPYEKHTIKSLEDSIFYVEFKK